MPYDEQRVARRPQHGHFRGQRFRVDTGLARGQGGAQVDPARRLRGHLGLARHSQAHAGRQLDMVHQLAGGIRRKRGRLVGSHYHRARVPVPRQE